LHIKILYNVCVLVSASSVFSGIKREP
jgi:hypothetical protein